MSLNYTADDELHICSKPDWFWKLGDDLRWHYRTITPTFLILGLTGHTVCLWAFTHQSKSEKAYLYQIFLTVAEIIDVIILAALEASLKWSGSQDEGLAWFRNSYFLMFYAAHVAIPLCHTMSIVTLLLSVSLVTDRLFAITKPFAYRNINRKKHQGLAVVISLLISILSTLYNARIFEVIPSNETNYFYKIQPDVPYVTSTLAYSLEYLCNGIRIIGLLTLIIFNIVLVQVYRKRLRTVINGNTGTSHDKQKEAETRAVERALFVQAISQSLFTGITTFSYIAFYTGAYSIPNFNSCEAFVFAPVLNITLMACDMADTCVTVVVNKKSRDIFLKLFR